MVYLFDENMKQNFPVLKNLLLQNWVVVMNFIFMRTWKRKFIQFDQYYPSAVLGLIHQFYFSIKLHYTVIFIQVSASWANFLSRTTYFRNEYTICLKYTYPKFNEFNFFFAFKSFNICPTSSGCSLSTNKALDANFFFFDKQTKIKLAINFVQNIWFLVKILYNKILFLKKRRKKLYLL